MNNTISAKFPSIREAAKRGPLSEHCLRLMQKQGKLPGAYSRLYEIQSCWYREDYRGGETE